MEKTQTEKQRYSKSPLYGYRKPEREEERGPLFCRCTIPTLTTNYGIGPALQLACAADVLITTNFLTTMENFIESNKMMNSVFFITICGLVFLLIVMIVYGLFKGKNYRIFLACLSPLLAIALILSYYFLVYIFNRLNQ